METIIKNLVNEIKNNLVHDMNCEQTGDDTTMLVIAAYNRYQEEERDGVDYIFDIRKGEDLKCCIDGGMTAQEIACLYEECTESTPYFMFGHSRNHAEAFETWGQMKTYLTNFLDSIITYMIALHDVGGYRQLFNHCISDYMIQNNLV